MRAIALTDNMGSEHKFQLYVDWLARGGMSFEPVRLSYVRGNLAALERCDGLLLTGGNDVDPSLYSGPVGHPKITSVDARRDEFEFRVIEKAMELSIPILGICRGMQVVNVHDGGTLLPDIEEAGYPSHRADAPGDCLHAVALEAGALLAELAPGPPLIVNSSHHQAVDVPGEGLRVAAKSPDGIIEGLERSDGRGGRFFLLVQWHPERMHDFDNPLSGGLLERFLSSMDPNIKATSNQKERQ